jgi:hypothetical protein
VCGASGKLGLKDVGHGGGPSYLGAMLAHYLDGVYLYYLEALLMNVILLKNT